MGVTTLRILRAAVLLASLAPALLAAPMLRLSTTTVGPVSVLTGSAGPAQVVEAYNAGDGALNLQVSASVPWITATVGAARPCSSQSGPCLPIQIGLQTESLPKGKRTGTRLVQDLCCRARLLRGCDLLPRFADLLPQIIIGTVVINDNLCRSQLFLLGRL